MSVLSKSDLQNDLGSSIAVKITAPVLWVLIAAGVIFAVFLQGNIKSQLADELDVTADFLAFELQSRLNKSKWELMAEDRIWLRKQIASTPIQSVTLTIGNKVTSVGGNDTQWEALKRRIVRDVPGLEDDINVADLELRHLSLDELVKDYRRDLLIKAGIPFLIFALTLAGLIHFSVTRPISELMEVTQAVTKGDLSKRISTLRQDEFGHLGRFMNEMLDKLQNQQEQLSEAVITAESASRAKSSFLANMSHEIRTPLTAIIGFSEVLREKGLTEAQRQHEVEAIIRSGTHLQEIINDILDFSKIEAGQLVIENITVSPLDLLDEIKSLFESRAEEKGLQFNLEIEYPFPKEVVTDPTRLKQILINLCSNAIKFTKEGSVNVLAKYFADRNKLFVSVNDTGFGMTEEEQQSIFQPFTQADVSTTRKFGGTGLGLCISNELAGKLGGNIRCQSEKSVGTKFILEVDAGEPASRSLLNSSDELTQQNSKPIETVTKPSLQGKVLLAEDNVDNQRLLGFYLKRAGVSFVTADNGAAAVRFAAEEHFDLVLMDMQMPVMDGVTAIRLLRQQGFMNPIVVLTANVLAEDRAACEKAGANDFLTKPVDVGRFTAMLENYLVNEVSEAI